MVLLTTIFMQKIVSFTLIISALTHATQAQQPKPPTLNFSTDSVALFTLDQDALQPGNELLRQQGYVSQIEPTRQGSLRFGIWRQHNTYLTADKTTNIRTGLNTLPALMQVSYTPTAEGPGGFGPVQDTPVSLASGLAQPLSFRANQISSLRGGVQTDKVLADQTSATDLNTLLADKEGAARDMGYRGDRYISSQFAVIGNELVITYQPFQFVPFSARYIPDGEPTMRKSPLNPEARNGILNTCYPQLGRLSYYHAKNGAILTIDTTGKVLGQVRLTEDLRLTPGMVLYKRAEVIGQPEGELIRPSGLSPVVATDWIFGPDAAQKENPTLRVVRTNTDGAVVFDHSFTITFPEYGLTQLEMLSDEGGALVHVTLGKGLLKYQVGYAYITPKGVAWQHIWDKKDPASIIPISGGSGPFRIFQNATRLVSLPDSRLMVLCQYDNGYGVQVLAPTGLFERYYSIKTRATEEGTLLKAADLHVVPFADGKVLLVGGEIRNARASVFDRFTTVDMELQQGLAPMPKAAPGQKNLFFNVTTGPVMFPSTGTAQTATPVQGARMALSLLKGKSVEEAVATSGAGAGSIGPDGRVAKFRLSTETSQYNISPVLYLLVPSEGTGAVRDMARYGYSLPGQPLFLVNPKRNEVLIPLRTLPRTTQKGARANSYPQAVFLKMVKCTW